jgi:SAM-dependent methyltransferase
MAEGATERPEIEIFQQQWNLYRKLVDQDYFYGTQVYPTLQRFLNSEFQRPFRFLDLACGDAHDIVGALTGTHIADYHGVDLSLPALELAKGNLDGLSRPVTLERADFTEAVKDASPRADVVWFGLSLHHLTTPRKRELMRDVRESLAPDGAFLIYEPTLLDGEDRPAFMDRFEALARETWTACSRDEVDAAVEHMRTSDLPETRGDWLTMGLEAGFSEAEELLRDPPELIRMFVFRV